MSEASGKVLTRMLIFRFRFEHRYGKRLTKVRGLDGLPFPASGENSWKIRICIILPLPLGPPIRRKSLFPDTL